MHVNHRFMLDFAEQQNPRGTFLDYGCGAGETVVAGRDRKMDIFGVENFYEGGPHTRSNTQNTGLVGERIKELGPEGQIPFPNATFDGVVANMVFEHVADLEFVCNEIRRVLKPEGFLLALFPSKEVIREGHCGVPFTHWLIRKPKVAAFALRAGHAVGMGYFREGKTGKQWADDFVAWLRAYCHYRPRKQILRTFADTGFAVGTAERDYLFYRLPHWKLLLQFLPVTFLMRRLATCVFILRRSVPPSP